MAYEYTTHTTQSLHPSHAQLHSVSIQSLKVITQLQRIPPIPAGSLEAKNSGARLRGAEVLQWFMNLVGITTSCESHIFK